jgi:hypothetical protein
MAKFNTGQSFADGDSVTGAKLNNITSLLNIYTGLISEQTAMSATVSTADQLLIADTDNGDSGAANRVTVQKLLNDALTNGTYTNAQLSGNLNVTQLSTLGTISSTRGTIGILNSTTGTITGLNTTTGTIATLNSTTGTVATLNSTTGTITGLNSTNGTVQTLTASTATITSGTYGGVINSSSGTYSGGINSTLGTIATLNSTTGTIVGLNTTTGTIATLNSTTGTITNLSTTLAGDFTISQGTGTIGASKVTPSQLSQPLTLATEVASTSGTAIDFTSIPSWAKRITVILNQVKTSTTSPVIVQIGSGSIASTAYVATGTTLTNAGSIQSSSSTKGFPIESAVAAAATTRSGNMIITLIGSNLWAYSFSGGSAHPAGLVGGGAKSLSGILDRLRLTTDNGTDTFAGGSVNIMYEG